MMNNPARYSFPLFAPALAGLALFGGCKAGPARVDGKAVSRLKPGHARFEELQTLLGPPTSVREWSSPNADIARTAKWGPRYFDWIFYLRPDGTVHQFEPAVYTWTITVVALPGSRRDESCLPPYRPPKAVAPEVAELFVPGLTTQSEVVAAWGPCSHALELAEGRYEISWGSHEDSWHLEFDSSGVLARAPRHDIH